MKSSQSKRGISIQSFLIYSLVILQLLVGFSVFWSHLDHSNSSSHVSPHALQTMVNEKIVIKFEPDSHQLNHVRAPDKMLYLSGDSNDEKNNRGLSRESVQGQKRRRPEAHEDELDTPSDEEVAEHRGGGHHDTELESEHDAGQHDADREEIPDPEHDQEESLLSDNEAHDSLRVDHAPQIVGDPKFHQHDFHLDGKIDTRETWEHLEGLPIWMKEYLTWHQEQRKLMNKDNWEDFKYIILQCVREDPHCGGTSDRLKPIPLLMYMAHKHKRMFFIWWTRPCALEEFLVPNAINWTVPEYLPLSNYDVNGKMIAKSDGLKVWSKKSERIIRCRMQTYDGGQFLYENMTDSTYNEIYHDLFRLLFEPSPAIAKILRKEMGEAHLVPGEYAVAHYRAFYARATRKESAIAAVAVNAVNCASQLRPGGPVYFASDSLFALENVRKYAQENSYNIVTIENQEPLHLDKAGNWTDRHPSDFYSIFVDLYLMGMGRCLTYGQGGFGKFGLLLSYNATCVSRHFYKKYMNKCDWAIA